MLMVMVLMSMLLLMMMTVRRNNDMEHGFDLNFLLFAVRLALERPCAHLRPDAVPLVVLCRPCAQTVA
eukprot:4071271-Pyramimonas_sp.AAC.1